MKTTYIYLLRNRITDGIYIGQTSDVKRRMYEHKSHSLSKEVHDMKLHRAIKQYGFENFEVTVLEEVPYNLKDSMEEYYIKKYNALSAENYNERQGTNLLNGIPHDSIVKEYLAGNSASKIGKQYGVKHPQIVEILKSELGEEKYFELSKKHTPAKKNIPIETIVDLIENQGKTKKETALILGVCDSTIVRRYNKHKKEQDSSYVVNPHNLGARNVDVKLILKTYSKLKSTRKTAIETGYSRSTVRRYLKKEGIL